MLGNLRKLRVVPSSLESRFARALSSLWVAYQPIVRWGERRLFGYEALMRSEEPTLADPAALLDAGDELDARGELGRTIRRRAAEGFSGAPEDTVLLVNLNPTDLTQDDLYDAAAPLSRIARRVVLEITERSSLDEVRDATERVRALKRLGFSIAVDDLGAGYAGLGHFALLEPQVVKLDMSLTREVDHHPTKQSVVRSMVSLCRELHLLMIGEGIETAAERDALALLGCDLLQGYLFARPSRRLATPQW